MPDQHHPVGIFLYRLSLACGAEELPRRKSSRGAGKSYLRLVYSANVVLQPDSDLGPALES